MRLAVRRAGVGARRAESGVRRAGVGVRKADAGVRRAESGVRSAVRSVRTEGWAVRTGEADVRRFVLELVNEAEPVDDQAGAKAVDVPGRNARTEEIHKQDCIKQDRKILQTRLGECQKGFLLGCAGAKVGENRTGIGAKRCLPGRGTRKNRGRRTEQENDESTCMYDQKKQEDGEETRLQ